MRSDPPYAGSGTDEAGPAATHATREWSNWDTQLSGPDDVRAIARRRLRLVGASPGSRILVVGCGRGDDVLALARLVRPGGRAFGVDRSEAELADARRRAATAGLAAKFHLGAPDDLPFPDASFDGACGAWLVTNIPDPNTALTEMVRAVRPGGRVVIDAIDWAGTVLHLEDPMIAERVLRHTTERRPTGSESYRIDHLAQAHGLLNLTVSTTPIVDRTGGTLRRFAELANAAAAEGEITASDAARFKADLAQAVAEKRSIATLPCVTMAGERP